MEKHYVVELFPASSILYAMCPCHAQTLTHAHTYTLHQGVQTQPISWDCGLIQVGRQESGWEQRVIKETDEGARERGGGGKCRKRESERGQTIKHESRGRKKLNLTESELALRDGREIGTELETLNLPKMKRTALQCTCVCVCVLCHWFRDAVASYIQSEHILIYCVVKGSRTSHTVLPLRLSVISFIA